MGPAEWATIVLASVTLLSAFVGGAFWLSRVDSAAKRALEEVIRSESDLKKEIADLEDKVIPSMQRRLDALEVHKADVAVLSAQMAMVIDRLSELSVNVQTLISGQARHDVRLETK